MERQWLKQFFAPLICFGVTDNCCVEPGRSQRKSSRRGCRLAKNAYSSPKRLMSALSSFSLITSVIIVFLLGFELVCRCWCFRDLGPIAVEGCQREAAVKRNKLRHSSMYITCSQLRNHKWLEKFKRQSYSKKLLCKLINITTLVKVGGISDE